MYKKHNEEIAAFITYPEVCFEINAMQSIEILKKRSTSKYFIFQKQLLL